MDVQSVFPIDLYKLVPIVISSLALTLSLINTAVLLSKRSIERKDLVINAIIVNQSASHTLIKISLLNRSTSDILLENVELEDRNLKLSLISYIKSQWRKRKLGVKSKYKNDRSNRKNKLSIKYSNEYTYYYPVLDKEKILYNIIRNMMMNHSLLLRRSKNDEPEDANFVTEIINMPCICKAFQQTDGFIYYDTMMLLYREHRHLFILVKTSKKDYRVKLSVPKETEDR